MPFFLRGNSCGIDDRPPVGIDVARLVCDEPQGRAVLSAIPAVGLELAQTVFQGSSVTRGIPRGEDRCRRRGAGLRKTLRRGQVLDVFGYRPPCVVALDVCGGAPFRGREIGRLAMRCA